MAGLQVQSEWMTHYVGSKLMSAGNVVCFDTDHGPILFHINPKSSPPGAFTMSRTGNQESFVSTNLSLSLPVMGDLTSLVGAKHRNGTVSLAFIAHTSGGAAMVQAFFGIDLGYVHDTNHWHARSASYFADEAHEIGSNHTVMLDLYWNEGNLDQPRLFVNTIVPTQPPGQQNVFLLQVTFEKAPNRITFRHKTSQDVALSTNPLRDTRVKAFGAMVAGKGEGESTILAYTSAAGSVLDVVDSSKSTIKLKSEGTLQSLIPYTNYHGATELLVGTDKGLYWYQEFQLGINGSSGYKQLDGSISHVRVMLPAEWYKGITIWMVRNHTEFGYVVLNPLVGGLFQDWIPVATGNFNQVSIAGLGDGPLARVVYSDAENTLHLLEESDDKVWKEMGLFLPAGQVLDKMTCYVSHVRLSTARTTEMNDRAVLIESTSSADVLVNGILRYVDEKGITAKTDSDGKLEIINLAETLATPNFSITHDPGDRLGGTDLPSSPFTLDPALKVKAELAKIKADHQLSDLQYHRSANGQESPIPVFPKNTNFVKLFTVLDDMKTQMEKLPEHGRPIQPPADLAESHRWDVWRHVESIADSLDNFVMEAGQLTVRIGDYVWRFFVSCYEEALQGLHTVFTAAGATLEGLQHWLGFIFPWDSIANTQRSLVAIVKTLGTCTDASIDRGARVLDNCLVEIRAKIDTMLTPDNPQTEKQNTPAVLDQEKTKNNNPPQTSHTAIDYIMGKIELLMNSDTNNPPENTGTSQEFWQTALPEILRGIMTDLATIKTILADLFSVGHTRSFKEILAQTGRTIFDAVIDAARAILVQLATFVKGVIRSFFVIIETEVYVPLLSTLWREALRSSNNPSVLDITMLIIAVPVTILGKLCTGLDFPTFTEEGFRPYFHENHPVALFNDPGSSSDESFLWHLYESCLGPKEIRDANKNITQHGGWLRVWGKYFQGYNTSAILVPVVIMQCIDASQSSKSPFSFKNPKSNKKLEAVYSIAKVLLQISYIPIIEDWDGTTEAPLRFRYWGLEWLATVFDIVVSVSSRAYGISMPGYEAIAGDGDPAMLLSMAFGVIALVMQEYISLADVQASEAGSMEKEVAEWCIIENVMMAVNRILSPVCPFIPVTEMRVEAASAAAYCGVMVGISSSLRFAAMGNTDSTFQTM